MSIKIKNIDKILSYIIGYSGLMIYFSWDDNFNMQVLLPIIIITILSYLLKNKFLIKHQIDFVIAGLISIVYTISLGFSLFFCNEAINEYALYRLPYSIIIILYFVTAINLFNKDNKIANVVLWGNILSGTFSALLVILNWLRGATGKISLLNYWGNYVEENYTAAFMTFSAILCCIVVLYASKLKYKILGSICFVIILFGVFLTGSRAAVLALIVSMLFMLIMWIYITDFGTLKKILIMLAIFTSLIILSINMYELLPEYTFNRFFVNSIDDSSNQERIQLWSFAFANFWYRPLFGYGPGVFSYYVSQRFTNHTVVVAHNTYIDFLIDSGIVGLFLILYLIYRHFKQMFREKCIVLFPLIICQFITSFIVGGERTFFFWNGLIVTCILLDYICSEEKGIYGLWEKN